LPTLLISGQIPISFSLKIGSDMALSVHLFDV